MVSKTPRIIGKLLDILERLKGTETKRLALRIIRSLSDEHESKILIGQHEGFKKILRLLLEKDPELTVEIVQTVKRLMESSQHKIVCSSGAQFLGSVVGDKISNLLLDMRKIIFTENTFNPEITPEPEHIEHSLSLSRETIQNMLETFKRPESKASVHLSQIDETDDSYDDNLSRDSFDADDEDDSDNDEILRELMRVQGALSSLTQVLREAAIPVMGQLDLVETICKLLFRNQQSQVEFKKLDGYALICHVLDQMMSCAVEDQDQTILNDCFNIFFTIALDGNHDKLVGNFDALELVLSLSTRSSNLPVRQEAIRCLHDFLSVNPRNAVIMMHLRGFENLMNIFGVLISEHPSLRTMFKHLGLEFNFEEPSEDAMLESMPWRSIYEYAVSLINLLNYAETILVNHNLNILQDYTRLLMDLKLPALGNNRFIVVLLLRSVTRLFEDGWSRMKSGLVPSTWFRDGYQNFLGLYLQLLRRINAPSHTDLHSRYVLKYS